MSRVPTRSFLLSGFVALTTLGCDLSSLVDQAEKFAAGIQIPAVGVDQVAAKVGQQGGEAVTRYGAVAVPEGALAQNVTLSVAEVPATQLVQVPDVLVAVSPPVAFMPHGTTFARPVTLTLFFSARRGGDKYVLRLDDEADRTWEVVDAADVELHEGFALVSARHFSVYTVVDCAAVDDTLAATCAAFKSGERTLDQLATGGASPQTAVATPVDAGAPPPAVPPEDAGVAPPVEGALDAGRATGDGDDGAQASDGDAEGDENDEGEADDEGDEVSQGGDQGDDEGDEGNDEGEDHAQTPPPALPAPDCAALAARCGAADRAACLSFATTCRAPEGRRCRELLADCREGERQACVRFGSTCIAP